jgi:hypothetical protein
MFRFADAHMSCEHDSGVPRNCGLDYLLSRILDNSLCDIRIAKRDNNVRGVCILCEGHGLDGIAISRHQALQKSIIGFG